MNTEPCPRCGFKLQSIGAINPFLGIACSAGDVTVCPRCGLMLAYETDGLHAFTSDELAKLRSLDPELVSALECESREQPIRYRMALARLN